MPIGGTTVASARAVFTADTAALERGAKKAEGTVLGTVRAMDSALSKGGAGWARFGQNLEALGKRTDALGKTMTRSFTVPLALAGGAAIKLSVDFQKSMDKIQGLAGRSRKEVDQLTQAVLKLAPAVGKSPKELADALFFIESAGIHGAKAMEVLRQSARASTAGLGETKVVADAVTSAINSYGASHLSARQAVDVLTAAVREGKTEASDFAPVLGRVLPIAARLHVSFSEVGAALATMTRQTGDAHQAAANLSGVFSNLIKPTKAGRDALEGVGLSYKKLGQVLVSGPNGLLNMLNLLNDRFNGNITAMAKVFPNVRALRGVLQLTGGDAGKTAGIFDRLANSTGSADKAFQSASQTADFKFHKALATLEVAAIKLGNALLPAAEQIARTLATIAEKFSNLSPRMQKLVEFAAVGLAALGPVLRVIGNIERALGLLVTAYAKTAAAATASSAKQVAANEAAGASAVTAGNRVGGFRGTLVGLQGVLAKSTLILAAFFIAFKESDLVLKLSSHLTTLGKVLLGVVLVSLAPVIASIIVLREAIKHLHDIIGGLEGALKAVGGFFSDVAGAVKGLAGHIPGLNSLLKALHGLLSNLVPSGLGHALSSAFGAAKSAIGDAWGAAKGFFGDLVKHKDTTITVHIKYTSTGTVADPRKPPGGRSTIPGTSIPVPSGAGIHRPTGKGLTQERTDQGLDFGGTGPIYAVDDGVMTQVNTRAGWGGPGGVFMEYRLTAGDYAGAYVYVAEQLTPAKGIKVGTHVRRGQVIAWAHGQIEIGWGSGAPQQTLAAATTGYKEGQVTPAGKSFASAARGGHPSRASTGAKGVKPGRSVFDNPLAGGGRGDAHKKVPPNKHHGRLANAAQVEDTIRAECRKHDVDEDAAVAVALQEGGLDPNRGAAAIGDGGTSFGPFQLHAGGALPDNVWKQGRAYADDWAWSQTGIAYAISQISKVSAGKRGAGAVSAIVAKFERPANVGAETRKAQTEYAKQRASGKRLLPVREGGPTVGPQDIGLDRTAKQLASSAKFLEKEIAKNLSDVPELGKRILPQVRAIYKELTDGVVSQADIARLKKRLELLKHEIANALAADVWRDQAVKWQGAIKKALEPDESGAVLARIKKFRDQVKAAYADGIITDKELKQIQAAGKRLKAQIALALQMDSVRDEAGKQLQLLNELFKKGLISPETYAVLKSQLEAVRQLVHDALKDGLITPAEQKAIQEAWAKIGQTSIVALGEVKAQLKSFLADGIITDDELSALADSAGEIGGVLGTAISDAIKKIQDSRANFETAWNNLIGSLSDLFDTTITMKIRVIYDTTQADYQLGRLKHDATEGGKEIAAALATGDPQAIALNALLKKLDDLWKSYYKAVADGNKDAAENILNGPGGILDTEDQVKQLTKDGLSDQAQIVQDGWGKITDYTKAGGENMVNAADTAQQAMGNALKEGFLTDLQKLHDALEDGKITWSEFMSGVLGLAQKYGLPANAVLQILNSTIGTSLKGAVDDLVAAINALIILLGGTLPGAAKTGKTALETFRDALLDTSGAAQLAKRSIQEFQAVVASGPVPVGTVGNIPGVTGGGGGGGPVKPPGGTQPAAGGMFLAGPRTILAGEAGPEWIIPENKIPRGMLGGMRRLFGGILQRRLPLGTPPPPTLADLRSRYQYIAGRAAQIGGPVGTGSNIGFIPGVGGATLAKVSTGGSGGVVPIDPRSLRSRVISQAKSLWGRYAGATPGAPSSIPGFEFVDGDVPAERAGVMTSADVWGAGSVPLPKNQRRVWWSDKFSDAFLNVANWLHDYSIGALLHEWSHISQLDKTLTAGQQIREGGATAYEQQYGPVIARAAGFPYKAQDPGPQYTGWENWVKSHLGAGFVKPGQFTGWKTPERMAGGGAVGLPATAAGYGSMDPILAGALALAQDKTPRLVPTGETGDPGVFNTALAQRLVALGLPGDSISRLQGQLPSYLSGLGVFPEHMRIATGYSGRELVAAILQAMQQGSKPPITIHQHVSVPEVGTQFERAHFAAMSVFDR